MSLKLWRDESGVALGIAVILIVIIGVMGAGLLVFVRNDLEAVVEVNQGEDALSAASAGVKAAENHLEFKDNSKQSYDGESPGGYDDTDDSEWSSANQGKDLNFDGDSAKVTIQYLTPSGDEDAAREPDNAPEKGAPYDNNRKYFKIISRGESRDAVRKIQAIYRTTNYALPAAYYATGNIDFNGNSTEVNGVSLFARGDVTDVRGSNITGNDKAYGNWAQDPDTGASNDYNATSRGTIEAGIGALGAISYKSGASRKGDIDYDTITNPEFVENTWGDVSNQPSDVITFPFPASSSTNDDEIIDALRSRARDQDNYVSLNGGESLTIEEGSLTKNYPTDSDLETVFFVEFKPGSKGDVTYKVSDPDGVKGTIVVVNGDLTTSSSADPFKGAFVVRDPDDADSETMEYKNSGNQEIDGYANVEGSVTLSGNSTANLDGALANGIPGLYKTEQWSWRELYE